MNIASLPAAYMSASCQPVPAARNRPGDSTEIIEETTAGSQEDTVSLSSGGRLLSQLPPLFSSEIEADGVITLDEMREFFQEKAAALGKEVRGRLTALGISADEPLDLSVDREGKVRVAGEHPQKDEIEALFAEDPELANDFRQVSSTGSFIKACEAHLEFAADYAQDPQAAVAKHWHLFSSLQSDYALRLAGEDISLVEAAA